VNNQFLNRLLGPSCAAADLDLVVVHSTRPAFEFADKRRILADCLSRIASRDELVIFTDAYDTMFLRGQRDIESCYERFAQPLVFSGELNSWPLGVVGIALHPGPPAGRYPYLNTGGFIGPAGDILDLCAKFPEPPSRHFDLLVHLRSHGYHFDEKFSWSDQYHWTLVHLLEPELIGIDHDASLFECYGPPIPDLVYSEVMRDVHEFEERGTAAGSYQRERRCLMERLQTPSTAAQVHFAGSVTKAAMLDLFDNGLLPDWLTAACGSEPARIRPGQIVPA